MNRPKRKKSRRQPALWTSPLVSMADVETRRQADRIDAQNRPFIITISLKSVMIIISIGMMLWGKEAIATRSIAVPDRESFGLILHIASRMLLWSVAPLFLVEVFFWRRRRRRWVFVPAAQLEAALGFETASLVLIAMVYVLVMGLLAANDRGMAVIAVFMTATLVGIYLIVTGIRRRVGWDPCCAKCAYPHPDDTLTTCPECGNPTPPRSHAAVILGRNVTSIPRIALGLLLLGAAPMLITFR